MKLSIFALIISLFSVILAASLPEANLELASQAWAPLAAILGTNQERSAVVEQLGREISSTNPGYYLPFNIYLLAYQPHIQTILSKWVGPLTLEEKYIGLVHLVRSYINIQKNYGIKVGDIGYKNIIHYIETLKKFPAEMKLPEHFEPYMVALMYEGNLEVMDALYQAGFGFKTDFFLDSFPMGFPYRPKEFIDYFCKTGLSMQKFGRVVCHANKPLDLQSLEEYFEHGLPVDHEIRGINWLVCALSAGHWDIAKAMIARGLRYSYDLTAGPAFAIPPEQFINRLSMEQAIRDYAPFVLCCDENDIGFNIFPKDVFQSQFIRILIEVVWPKYVPMITDTFYKK